MSVCFVSIQISRNSLVNLGWALLYKRPALRTSWARCGAMGYATSRAATRTPLRLSKRSSCMPGAEMTRGSLGWGTMTTSVRQVCSAAKEYQIAQKPGYISLPSLSKPRNTECSRHCVFNMRLSGLAALTPNRALGDVHGQSHLTTHQIRLNTDAMRWAPCGLRPLGQSTSRRSKRCRCSRSRAATTIASPSLPRMRA